jgi:hypothetical protein
LMFFISSHPAQFSHFHWSFHELTSHHCGETLSYSAKAEAGEVNLSILFGTICMHPVSCYLVFISDIYKSGYHQCWQIGNYGYRFSFWISTLSPRSFRYFKMLMSTGCYISVLSVLPLLTLPIFFFHSGACC